MDSLHARQVDDEAAVAECRAGDAVSSAANGHQHLVLAGEPNGSDDVGDAGTLGDEAGRLSIVPFQILRVAS